MRTWALLAALSGCVSPGSTFCADGTVCPAGRVCDLEHQLCIAQDQLAACAGRTDGEACVFGAAQGVCDRGVCIVAVCGDGVVLVAGGEQCDDRNTADGDGCAADCRSNEQCGNGVVDFVTGETCDDGNHVDHDGCSSACRPEIAQWVAAVPPPRYNARLAYDARRDRVVMFGGENVMQLGDTWEWDGTWTPVPPTPTPPPRTYFGMAYDHERTRVIVFGGDGVSPFGETWSWDGAVWTFAGQGPPVVGHDMVYDARRRRVVLFGGIHVSTSVATAETWEWDGTSWTERVTAATPPGRSEHAMAYDPDRGVVVMYGGFDAGSTALDDVWEYDGTSWIDRTPSTGPAPPAMRSTMAYCRATRRVVLGPGNTGDQITDQVYAGTWLWDGTSWTASQPHPAPRIRYAFGQDGFGRVIMTAGTTASGPLSDTWSFDGTIWTRVDAPGHRAEAGIAHDRDLDRVLVFGGHDGATRFDETWELSRGGWRNLMPAASAMVYDPARREVVLFGGVGPAPSNATWTFAGATWMFRTAAGPSNRSASAIAYDPRSRTVLLFGGRNNAGVLGDTWRWDGTTWTQLQPATVPPARAGAVIAHDAIRDQIVMFGGGTLMTPYGGGALGDTWIWDGADWRQEVITVSPSPREGATFVAVPNRRSLVLAGGTPAGYLDTWEWAGAWQRIGTFEALPARHGHASYASGDGIVVIHDLLATGVAKLRWDVGVKPGDACMGAIELDGDGLAGCADPDCWATCAPWCPPELPATCTADSAHCGDGTCSALESCRSCPGDCAACVVVCGDFICDPGETCPGDCG
jgi:cysteine-rich repeat protein